MLKEIIHFADAEPDSKATHIQTVTQSSVDQTEIAQEISFAEDINVLTRVSLTITVRETQYALYVITYRSVNVNLDLMEAPMLNVNLKLRPNAPLTPTVLLKWPAYQQNALTHVLLYDLVQHQLSVKYLLRYQCGLCYAPVHLAT